MKNLELFPWENEQKIKIPTEKNSLPVLSYLLELGD